MTSNITIIVVVGSRFLKLILGLLTLLLISAMKLSHNHLWSPYPVNTGSRPMFCLELHMSQMEPLKRFCSLGSSLALWAQRNNLQKLIYPPLKIYTHFLQTCTMKLLLPAFQFSPNWCSKWLSFFCSRSILFKWVSPTKSVLLTNISSSPFCLSLSPAAVELVNWI